MDGSVDKSDPSFLDSKEETFQSTEEEDSLGDSSIPSCGSVDSEMQEMGSQSTDSVSDEETSVRTSSEEGPQEIVDDTTLSEDSVSIAEKQAPVEVGAAVTRGTSTRFISSTASSTGLSAYLQDVLNVEVEKRLRDLSLGSSSRVRRDAEFTTKISPWKDEDSRYS